MDMRDDEKLRIIAVWFEQQGLQPGYILYFGDATNAFPLPDLNQIADRLVALEKSKLTE